MRATTALPVMTARPAMLPTATSPRATLACSVATRSSWARPDARCSSTSPSAPSACTAEYARSVIRPEQAGRSIVMATEPFLSPETVVLTVSWPALKSTLVRLATFTSDVFAGSMGSTSTTVSARSVAASRT